MLLKFFTYLRIFLPDNTVKSPRKALIASADLSPYFSVRDFLMLSAAMDGFSSVSIIRLNNL